MTVVNARVIEEQIGNVIMVEYPIATGTRDYLRMRVDINTNMPLSIKFRLPRKDGSKSLIRLMYEGLKRFCFRCGRLGDRGIFRPFS